MFFIGFVIEEGGEEVGEKRKSKDLQVGYLRHLLKRRGVSTQESIKNLFNKGLRDEFCLKIARFFYNNAIPLNVARSEEYIEMVESRDKIVKHPCTLTGFWKTPLAGKNVDINPQPFSNRW